MPIPWFAKYYRAAALVLFACAVTPGDARFLDEERLSLVDARHYLLGLINFDRASKGLKPVKLDPAAAEAGQKHAEEMAAQGYLSHWNLEGKPPDQRYTEAAGVHHVSENVFLTYRYAGARPERMELDPQPTFTRLELEEIEEAYYNERPPDDGHRRNILNPNHTHVGIGLARARDGDRAETIANAQEFVDRYIEPDPIPREARPGQRITVSGRAPEGIEIRTISLSRSALPKMLTKDELSLTRSYKTTRPFRVITRGATTDDHLISLPGGRFQANATLDDQQREGLYYITVWARQGNEPPFVVSQRTVIVR